MPGEKKRPDGRGKVTGKLQYMTDLSFPGMLYAKVLRSAHPHAKILSISTKAAEETPGVAAVITAKDVPGLNGFGIVMPDQPVLCEDTVRFVGDAVAAVAADSYHTAALALSKIKVEYEELEVVTEPKRALEPDAPQLHPNGNLLHEASFSSGNVERGFAECAAIVEETYCVPRQMHTYMETEGGVVVPEPDGSITVYIGTQHGYKDRFQLSRLLGLPEEKIRIISSPIGGSFGGKDELNIQPYAAILALKTGRPVKIHQTRYESVISGLKRHPMEITMKTGADAQGKLLAHQTKIIADTGAYATLGPAILEFAVEHAAGPYIIPNLLTEGYSVFTNNGVAGEFRGFGGNQITFALEGQIDRLAEKIGLDSVEMRELNIRKKHDRGPLGQRIAATDGAREVLHAAAAALEQSSQKSAPFKLYGKGIAVCMHGGGLGFGRLDPAGGRLAFRKSGKIEAAFGFEECGQGILTVIEEIITAELGIGSGDFNTVIGDTALVPSTGSTTASRGTSMVWHAVQNMKQAFTEKMAAAAAERLELQSSDIELAEGGFVSKSGEFLLAFEDLAKSMSEEIIVETVFDFPTTPDEITAAHFLYTFSGVLAEVEIDRLTGKVKLLKLDQFVAAGPVVNKRGYQGQIEGGGVMAAGYTLMEEALITEGKYISDNLDTYLVPTMADIPAVLEVHPIEALEEEDIYGPRGVGEIGTVAVAPAITKAIHDATGHWVSTLPVSAEEMLEVCEKEEKPWTRTKQPSKQT